MQRILLQIYLILLLSNFGYSQNYSYQQFTTEDGLPTNYVYGVVEDQKGYIWAYTENGVSKFDGHTFKNYSVEDGLIYNDIVYMEEDSSGVLWLHGLHNDIQYIKNDSIYTFNGLEENDIVRVRKYFCNTDPNHSEYYINKNERYSKIMKFSNGNIIDTFLHEQIDTSNTLFRDDYIRNTFLAINHERRYNVSKDGSYYFEMIKDSLHSMQLEVPLLKTKRNIYFFTPINCKKPFNLSITEDQIVFLDILQKRSKIINIPALMGGKCKEMSFQIQDSFLLMQTSLGHAKFDFNWNLLDVIKFEDDINQYGIKRSIKDSHGNLWVGTRDAGLLLFTKSCLQNPIINSQLEQNQSFNKLYTNKEGTIFSISDNAQLSLIEDNKMVNLSKLDMGSAHIRNTIPGPDGNILISNAFKTMVIEGDKGYNLAEHPYFKNLKKDFKQSTISRKVRNLRRFDHMYFDQAKERLYCSYPEFTAVSIEKKKENFIIKDLGVIGKFFYHDTFNDILYLSGSEGLSELKENGELELIFKLKAITSFLIIDKDSYLIGTESSGLYLYQPSTKNLKKLNSHRYIRKIVKEGELYYLASNEGVVVGSIIDTQWTPNYTYNKKDGLQSEEVRDILIQGNYIYATSFKSIIKLNKQTLNQKKNTESNLQALSINEIFSISKNTIIENIDPIFKYNQNDISFSYHLQNYDSNGEIIYEYKLEPIQSEWQKTSERTQQFFNLQADSYTLHLKATDVYSRVYSLEEPYAFEIKNPFWKTWWFILTCILLFLYGIITALKIKSNRIANEVEAEKELNNKIASFKIDALRSQMNPHFVFNALSSIQYYIQKNNAQKADKYLTMFGRLIRKYLDFAKVKTITIKQEIDLLTDYIRLEEMRFESLFTTEIIVDPTLDIQNTFIPTMLVQPYIENAINHGLQQRRDGMGILKVAFKKINENGLEIIVADNGIGIQRSKSTKSNFHDSHGMDNIMDRISFLKLSQKLDILLEIDTYDPTNNEFPGTLIMIEIKDL